MKKSMYGSIVLVFSLMLIIFSACNLPSSGLIELSDKQPGDQIEVMAIVLNQLGEPMEFAALGDYELLTDGSGVAHGEVRTTEAGWIPVSAGGFATTYAFPITTINEISLLWVTLTPIETGILYDADTGGTLIHGEGAEFELSVSLDPHLFGDEQAALSLTEIPLQTLDAHYQPLSTDEPLHLQRAFNLDAISNKGEPLSPGNEGNISVRIPLTDAQTNTQILASFDPSTGMWDVTDTVCTVIGEIFLECSLPHFSTHGIFGIEPPEDEDNDQHLSGDDGDFTDALDDHRGAAGGGAAGSSSGEGGADEGADGATDNVIENAQSGVDGGGGEKDKMALMIAAGLAMESGKTSMGEQLLEEARHETRKIGEQLLQSARCETYYQLLTTAAQAQALGGLQDLATRLIDEASELHKKCVMISGTITYYFYLNPLWPGSEKWIYNRGTQLWTEVHKMRINIDPKTGAVDGEDHVTLSMPPATYRVEDGSPCGPVRIDKAIENNPHVGSAILLFEGSYDGDIFQIGEMQVAQADPVGMEHTTYYNPTYYPPPGCGAYNQEISRNKIADYTSHLLHGFFGQPQPPSLQTMLNEGERIEFKDYKVVWGMEGITYTRGQNLSPLIPAQGAKVHWRFTQVSTVGGGS